MGHRSYGSPIVRGDLVDAHVGKYCSIAQNVVFDCGWDHETEFVTTYPLNVFFKELHDLKGHPKSKGPIIIGNDVWICEGALILGRVHIGNGAVIGAGAVVTKNVDAYSIVGGNPARHIRYRFSQDIIQKLEQIKWWDWPDEKVIKHGHLLMNKNITEFVNLHYEKS